MWTFTSMIRNVLTQLHCGYFHRSNPHKSGNKPTFALQTLVAMEQQTCTFKQKEELAAELKNLRQYIAPKDKKEGAYHCNITKAVKP